MKKIAYLGNNSRNCLRRFEAYFKNTDKSKFKFSYIVLEHHHLYHEDGSYKQFEYEFDMTGIRVIYENKFVYEDYDLIMIGSDKLFRYVTQKLGIKNINDKLVLAQLSERYDIAFPKTLNVNCTSFNDDDLVFVKPKVSSGSYSPDDFGYKKLTYSQVKDKINDSYIVQEFTDSTDSLVMSFVSDGTSLFFIDACEYTCQYNEQGKMVSVGTDGTKEAYSKIVSLYSSFIEKVFAMLFRIEYNAIPGFYNVQAAVINGVPYLYDINLRTGPVSVEIELNELAKIEYYQFVEHYVGDKEFEIEPYSIPPTKSVAEYCWLTSINGKFLSTELANKIEQYKNTKQVNKEIQLSDNKGSGIFNSHSIVSITTFKE